MRHTDDELAANISPPQFPDFFRTPAKVILSGLATFMLLRDKLAGMQSN